MTNLYPQQGNNRSLRSKRFRAVSEQRKTEERDSRFWPREKWNESQKMNRLLAPFFARSLLRNGTETLATQATTIGNECILDKPIYTELKFSESCCHFSFFWRQLFISSACVLEDVLNTGSDVSICSVYLTRASFCRKMSTPAHFLSLCI